MATFSMALVSPSAYRSTIAASRIREFFSVLVNQGDAPMRIAVCCANGVGPCNNSAVAESLEEGSRTGMIGGREDDIRIATCLAKFSIFLFYQKKYAS
ncbi:MAG: hypothetical protein J0L97_10200 [Alphaproteobacteria bacterium]|nr:hypothetical protein [Alphaproteobacteria bacterium]